MDFVMFLVEFFQDFIDVVIEENMRSEGNKKRTVIGVSKKCYFLIVMCRLGYI